MPQVQFIALTAALFASSYTGVTWVMAGAPMPSINFPQFEKRVAAMPTPAALPIVPVALPSMPVALPLVPAAPAVTPAVAPKLPQMVAPKLPQIVPPPTAERPVQQVALPPTAERPVKQSALPPAAERPVQQAALPPAVERPVQQAAPPPTTERPVQQISLPRIIPLPTRNSGDGDPQRDSLRAAALKASTAYARTPCNDAAKAIMIDAVSAYAQAWADMMGCGPQGCDYKRINATAAIFSTPLDIEVRNAIGAAFDKRGISIDDFPSTLRINVAMLVRGRGAPATACAETRAQKTPAVMVP